MITLDDKNGGDGFRIKGRKVRRDKDGNYIVTPERIMREDLSMLPSGTELLLDRSNLGGSDFDNPVCIAKVSITGHQTVRVFFHLVPDPYDLLSWRRFQDAVYRIFRSAAGRQTSIRDVGYIKGVNPLFWVFSIEVPNGRFSDIQSAVTSAILQLMQPVIDFQNRMSEEFKKEFGD